MVPTLRPGDLILVMPLGLVPRPQVGEIIVYRSRRDSVWVVHRVVDGDPDAGYVTQGDANPLPDIDRVSVQDMVGFVPVWREAAIRVPHLGFFSQDRGPLSSPLAAGAALVLGLYLLGTDAGATLRALRAGRWRRLRLHFRRSRPETVLAVYAGLAAAAMLSTLLATWSLTSTQRMRYEVMLQIPANVQMAGRVVAGQAQRKEIALTNPSLLPRQSRRARHAPPPRPGRPLALAALLLSLSLGGLMRAYALPVEATTRESWYSYQQELAFDFVARVRQGTIYGHWSQTPDQLVQTRLPVEPAAFRRVLVARLTEAVDIRLPYRFTADHPGEMTARFRVDGYMVAPNLWRRPYPLVPQREYRVSGAALELNESVRIPVQQLLEDFQQVQAETGLGQDVIELHLHPVIEVDVAGQRQPVQARLAPEFMLVFRGGNIALEIDEPRVISDAQSFSETRVVPLTVRLLGRDVPVATVRSAAMGGLGASCLALLALAGLRWLRRKPGADADLRRLGAAVIRARSFEIPPGAALVEVSTVRQLLELHVQTERPVVRAGDVCYLLDGSACYRLFLGDSTPR